MRLRTAIYMMAIVASAILLIPPAAFEAGGNLSMHVPAADVTPAPHNCRFWGAIGNVLDPDVLVDQLITQPQSLENLSSSNSNGWALVHFAGEDSIPVIHRSFRAAYEDTIYEVAVDMAGADSPRIVIGHVRNCTSGLCDIPNPHPFHRFKNGRHWFLGHNGSVDKQVLLDLIRPEYLAANPPEIGGNIEEWVDSELYFLYILQSLEDHDWQMGPALGEVVEWLRVLIPGDIEQLNFVMTDGETLWAYREGISLYYRFNTEGSIYCAVASKHPSEQQGDWSEMVDGQLVTMRRGVPPILQHIEDFFTSTIVGETAPTGPRMSAFPNPFNPATTLRLNLPEAGIYRLAIHDPTGRRRAVLAEGSMEAGDHQWTWRALDENGHSMPSGVYLARLSGEGYSSSMKLILIQ